MVSNSGPVVDNPNKGAAILAYAVGGIAVVGLGAWLIYGPDRQTAKDLSERHRVEAEASKPGSPGKRWEKPRFEDVPTQASYVTEAPKPALVAERAAPPKPPRPRPASMPVLVAAADPAPAPVQREARQPQDTKPRRIGGVEVAEAVRIDDASWFLTPGEKIMCRNNEPLTERNGASWTATIPEAKLSRDGSRVLIPAMSQAFGTIALGFSNGERRLAAVIDNITGPRVTGQPTLFVPIDKGQVGDSLGRIDLDGNIENDFWGRLGTVGAYAALDMVARGGASFITGQANHLLNGGGNDVNVNIGNLSGMNAQTLSGAAMRETLNRRPKFDRPQAQDCTIMIKNFIDFRKAITIGR
jgi:type IV secretory pathway VirB10-like protein